ncbi:MAG: hypothetical protein II882_03770 [Lachnospiraceae bacterium]|nr:hypothetical protein [Lachnospiraceae bacterium]
MTTDQLKKVYRRMLWIIPGMLLAMIGDYCMGIEPKDSYAISGMISSGWLTIADWRIAVSNIGGLLGTACYSVAALPFAAFLQTLLPDCKSKGERRLLKVYIIGLILGVMCFLYFHLECGTLIYNFNLLYEAAGGNTELAVNMWNRSYMVQIVPYWATFFAFELSILFSWIALIWKGSFKLKKVWILAAPLIVAGIGYLLELLIPWPFNDFVSGFESFGWIVMFLGGRKLVLQAMQEQDKTEEPA